MKKGIVVSPHHEASRVGAKVLEAGGNALEAAVAVAASLCIVYPHMTGLGGDAFWLIAKGGEEKTPLFINASGSAGQKVSLKALNKKGYEQIPTRGAYSALTMAGAVSGWEKAMEISEGWSLKGHKKQSLRELFAPAVQKAQEGFAVTPLLHSMLKNNLEVLLEQPNFSDFFLKDKKAPEINSKMRLPLLGKTLERLAHEGLDSFYRGNLAQEMAADLKNLDSPLSLEDFKSHTAGLDKALSLKTQHGYFYNSPPSTQGVASLLILGQYFKLYAEGKIDSKNEEDNIHAIVEATKNAFYLCSRELSDPKSMQVKVEDWLEDSFVSELASKISMDKAAPWPVKSSPGDTVWFGLIDKWGNAVSCIQSIYHEFGSGMVLPSTGIVWHNRALGFSLDPKHPNFMQAGKRPFHTLNPAMARLKDGRFLSYGSMGGEGQPQSQAALIYRYLLQGLSAQDSIEAPRWLLGRTWGGVSDNLKLEGDLSEKTIESLKNRGHDTETLEAQSSLMGHAGLLIQHKDGRLEGGYDPRSDGSVELA